jgi:hypothetical protein
MAVALFIVSAVPAVSRAQHGHGHGEDGQGEDGQGQDGQGQDEGRGVPEFDIATAGAAVALLAGGFQVLNARRRRRAG